MLVDDNTRFNRFAQSDFIGENDSIMLPQRFHCAIDGGYLMRKQVNPNVAQRERKTACAAVFTLERQLMGPIFQKERMHLSFLLEFKA